MILDLFIYIIQFYINQNTFLPGFIIRKEAAEQKVEEDETDTIESKEIVDKTNEDQAEK